jgi:DNA-binding transcriptional LysR family regulator
VVLTEAGERFLPHARRALDALEAGVSELGHLSSTPHGKVALGTLHTVGAYLVPQLLPGFIRRHPEVHVRVSEGVHDQLEEQVARGELDLAILNLPLRRLDLVAQKLWQEDLILAVPKGHRLARLGRPVALGEAVGEPWIIIPRAAGTQALEAACAERGEKPRVALETDNAEAMRRMVEAGLGVALLPALIARAPGNFEVVRVGQGGVTRQVAVIHRGEGYLTAAARALKALIVEQLQAKPAG